MIWRLRQSEPALCRALAESAKIHPITAQTLINRGITDPAMAEDFFRPRLRDLPDPFLLPDMVVAVDRVAQAVTDGEQITIYGDYDTDGVCATALLVRFFALLGVVVDYYVPHRTREGYGMHPAAIEILAARGTKVLISVDTGTTAEAAIAYARVHGITTIVTDHHEVRSVPAAACAVVNPKRADSVYPFRELCGTGVAFKLAVALRHRLRVLGWFATRSEPKLRGLLDLVAVATVADIVPLIGENRVLTAVGLQVLGETPQCGLRAVMAVAGVDPTGVGSYAVGFHIAPRLNAAGRLADASAAVELLLTEDPSRATALAGELHRLNGERQKMEQAIRLAVEARLQSDPLLSTRASIVCAAPGWPAGVVGLVAGRVAEAYRLPTIVIGLEHGLGRGSARTVGEFPLLQAIAGCGEWLEAFGGHAAAAGVTIRAERVEQFACAFDDAARALLRPEDRERIIVADAEITAEAVTFDLAQELARLEPFGLGNREPIFLLRNCAVRGRRVVGKNHLQLQLVGARQLLRAIGFSLGDHPQVGESVLDLIFTPELNSWNGRTAVQLKLRDLRKPEAFAIDTVRQN